MVVAHRTPEPGHAVITGMLGHKPLLDLDISLAGGIGACLAMPVLDAAARVLATLSTRKEARLG